MLNSNAGRNAIADLSAISLGIPIKSASMPENPTLSQEWTELSGSAYVQDWVWDGTYWVTKWAQPWSYIRLPSVSIEEPFVWGDIDGFSRLLLAGKVALTCASATGSNYYVLDHLKSCLSNGLARPYMASLGSDPITTLSSPNMVVNTSATTVHTFSHYLAPGDRALGYSLTKVGTPSSVIVGAVGTLRGVR